MKKPRNVSPSQISSFRRCPRAWWWEKIQGIKTPETQAQAEGTAMHSLIEAYLLRGAAPSGPLAKFVLPGLEHLPKPPYPRDWVESRFAIYPIKGGIPMIGSVDLVEVDRITDHKTTSDFRYTKSDEALRGDPQAIVYGSVAHKIRKQAARGSIQIWDTRYHVYDLDLPTEPETFRHVYYRRGSRGPGCMQAEVKLDPSDISFGMARIIETMQEMDKVSIIPDAGSVPCDWTACNDYGGCHHRDRCSAYKTATSPFAGIGVLKVIGKNKFQAGVDKLVGGSKAPTEKPWEFDGTTLIRKIGTPEIESLIENVIDTHNAEFIGYLREWDQLPAEEVQDPYDASELIKLKLVSSVDGVLTLTHRGREVADLLPENLFSEPMFALSYGDEICSFEEVGSFFPGVTFPVDYVYGEDSFKYDPATRLVVKGGTVFASFGEAGREQAARVALERKKLAPRPTTGINPPPPPERGLEPPKGAEVKEVKTTVSIPKSPGRPAVYWLDGSKLYSMDKVAQVAAYKAARGYLEALGLAFDLRSEPETLSTTVLTDALRGVAALCAESEHHRPAAFDAYLAANPVTVGAVKGARKKNLPVPVPVKASAPEPKVVVEEEDQDPVVEAEEEPKAPISVKEEEPKAIVEEEEPKTPIPSTVPFVEAIHRSILLIDCAPRFGTGGKTVSLDMIALELLAERAAEVGTSYGAPTDSREERQIAEAFAARLKVGQYPQLCGSIVVASRRTPGMDHVLAALLPEFIAQGGLVFERG